MLMYPFNQPLRAFYIVLIETSMSLFYIDELVPFDHCKALMLDYSAFILLSMMINS